MKNPKYMNSQRKTTLLALALVKKITEYMFQKTFIKVAFFFMRLILKILKNFLSLSFIQFSSQIY